MCFKVNGVGLDFKSNKKKTIKRKNKINKILVISAYKIEKGYLEILKVAKIFQNQKIYIDCFGYGNYEEFKKIKLKENIKNISFNKFDPNLLSKIKNYDIFLHLSKREGLPVSIMQCLSKGLPVICYNIRGNNDLIKNNFNGFFVKSCEEVFDKIVYLNNNSKLIHQMKKMQSNQ